MRHVISKGALVGYICSLVIAAACDSVVAVGGGGSYPDYVLTNGQYVADAVVGYLE